jgi:hypothetical protein
VRSKLVHGDTLKPNQIAELPRLSAECDVYLRTILREIFISEHLKKIFDSHNEAIEDYFFSIDSWCSRRSFCKVTPRMECHAVGKIGSALR